MPKVSVIIPTYNRALYIAETLESVFSQTFKDYEVIVVDDGSSDNTADVLKPYMVRIDYIRKENGGQGSARNAGIKVACGEYIAFLDSDDLWVPEKLEIQTGFADEHPDAGLIFSDYVVFRADESGQTKEMKRVQIKDQELSFHALFHGNFIPTLTVFVRRSCINGVGLFDESRDLIGGEDYEMWLRIAMKYKLAHIPAFLAKYRDHNNNILGMDLERNCNMHMSVIRKLLSRHPDVAERYHIDIDDYYRDYFYRSGRELYQNKRFIPAVRYLRQALSYNSLAPKALVLYFMSLLGVWFSALTFKRV